MKLTREELRLNYNEACNAYLMAFCEKHEFDYAENVEQIKDLWPEAYMIECEEVNEITFTTRFPKPEWYN